MTDWMALATEVAEGAVAEHAAQVVSTGNYPEQSLQAVRDPGLLGLISSKDIDGAGQGLAEAAGVVERLARECGSTGMITCMHYCGTATREKCGSESDRRNIAAGKRLTTLAFSEAGSRSQFWAPVGHAERRDGEIVLNAHKGWVTSARHVAFGLAHLQRHASRELGLCERLAAPIRRRSDSIAHTAGLIEEVFDADSAEELSSLHTRKFM